MMIYLMESTNVFESSVISVRCRLRECSLSNIILFNPRTQKGLITPLPSETTNFCGS